LRPLLAVGGMPKITAQRGIGLLYTAFASWVFLSVMIDRIINMHDILVPLDGITILCIFAFFLSIFIESKIFKSIQVVMIIIVSYAILTQGNYYLSLALFTNAFFILYAYGAFNKFAKTKIIIAVVITYSLFAVSSYAISSGLISMMNWLIFIIVHVASIAIVFKSTIDKAKQFDQSIEMQLNLKIDETTKELYKTRVQLERAQTQLNDAVLSGVELLAIVKEIKNGRGQ
jgi:hypothetical protein